MTTGWNSSEAWAVSVLVRKATDAQLGTMLRVIKQEVNRRWEAQQGRYSDCCGAFVTETGHCNECGKDA